MALDDFPCSARLQLLTMSFFYPLYKTGRLIESFSVAAGTGHFENTGRGLCRACFAAELPDHELCSDCRIQWLLGIKPTKALEALLSLSAGASAIFIGICAFWLEMDSGWSNPSPVMAAIIAFLPNLSVVPCSRGVLAFVCYTNIAILVLSVGARTFTTANHRNCDTGNGKWKPQLYDFVCFFEWLLCLYFFEIGEVIQIVAPQVYGYNIILRSLWDNAWNHRSTKDDIERADRLPGQEKRA